MWVRVDQSLRDHPKVKKFRRILNISKQEAIGYLVMLWSWAYDYAKDGQIIPPYTDDDIADAVEFEGDPIIICNALQQAGFLDLVDTDKNSKICCIHDWPEYAGKHLEKLARDRERKQRDRDRKKLQKEEQKLVDSDEQKLLG